MSVEKISLIIVSSVFLVFDDPKFCFFHLDQISFYRNITGKDHNLKLVNFELYFLILECSYMDSFNFENCSIG